MKSSAFLKQFERDPDLVCLEEVAEKLVVGYRLGYSTDRGRRVPMWKNPLVYYSIRRWGSIADKLAPRTLREHVVEGSYEGYVHHHTCATDLGLFMDYRNWSTFHPKYITDKLIELKNRHSVKSARQKQQ